MTPAVTAAKRAGIEFEVAHSTTRATPPSPGAQGAARALGIAPERVFKTLVVDLAGASLAVAIVPVAARVDLKAVAAALGAKRAAMAEPAAAERAPPATCAAGSARWASAAGLPSPSTRAHSGSSAFT